MPTYEYVCTDCAERTEAVQRFSDDPLTVCLVCGGRLRKVFSPVGIVFKGSGFYRTDSRDGAGAVKEKQPNASEPDSAPAADSGAGKDKDAGSPGEKKPAKPASSPATSGESSSASSSPPSSSSSPGPSPSSGAKVA